MVVREPAVVQCVVVEKKFSSFFIRKKESIIHDVGNMHMHAIRLLQPINDRFRSLREGNGMETTLISFHTLQGFHVSSRSLKIDRFFCCV